MKTHAIALEELTMKSSTSKAIRGWVVVSQLAALTFSKYITS